MNTFLPMINDILFLLHKNPRFGIWRTLGKHFLPPAGCGSVVPAKSCWDPWRNGSQLARSQVNMADETKLHSPIRSTFEALVVQHAVEHRHGEKLGPSCWPVLAADIAFAVHFIDLLSILLGCNGFSRIQKAAVDQTGSRRQNNDHDPFISASLALGSALELLLGLITELVIAGCRIKSTNQEMVCCHCIE